MTGFAEILVSRGVPKHIARAFEANARDESSLRPDINEVKPLVKGSRGGYGLLQWTGPRRKALEAYAVKRGQPVSDMGLQVDFLLHELGGSESRAARKIFAQGNAADAAVVIMNDFLRPHKSHRPARERRYREVLTGGGGAAGLAGGERSSFFDDRLNDEPASERDTAGRSSFFDEGLGPQVQKQAPQAPQGMEAEREPGFLERQGQAVRDLVVGNAEYDAEEFEAAPEATSDLSDEKWRDLRNKLFAADGEAAMANIIRAELPDAEIEADRNGNLYAVRNGERFALDRAGLSGRDITELAKVLTLGAITVLPAARAGGATLGAAGRIAGGAVGAAGEQTLEQVVSNAAGGGQPFDAGRIIAGAVFGLGGEALGKFVEVVGPKVWGAISQAMAGGKTADEFRVALEAQGLDLTEVNEILSSGLDQAGAKGLGPDALARIADARSLPVPVELTAGQATRDPRLSVQETMARTTGAFGEDVQAEALGRSALQQQALRENADQMVSGASPLGDRGARGGALQERLVRSRDAAKKRVDEAYSLARNADGQARLSANAIQKFAQGLRQGVRKMAVPSQMQSTREAIDELESLLDATGARVTAVDIRALETWRSQVSGALKNAEGGDRAGLSHLIRQYDQNVVKGFGSEIRGDASTVGLWRQAVASRRKFGKTFENDSIVDRLTRQGRKRRDELDVDAEDVMAELMGASSFGKKGTAREVLRLKEFLGANSEAWGAIKAEGLVRLLGFEPGQVGGGNVSAMIVGNLRKARKDHPQLMQHLFSADEIRALRKFSRTVEAVNISPRIAGDANPSGSGRMAVEAASLGFQKITRAAEALGRQFGAPGRLMANVIVKFVTGADSAAQAAAMRRSLSGLPPVASPSPALPGAGAAAGGQVGGGL